MNIFKTLDVSTFHIPQALTVTLTRRAQALGKPSKPLDQLPLQLNDVYLGVQMYYDTGWTISVMRPNDPMYPHLRLLGHGALVKIMMLAGRHDCRYVRIHADGDLLDDFEKFDW